MSRVSEVFTLHGRKFFGKSLLMLRLNAGLSLGGRRC